MYNYQWFMIWHSLGNCINAATKPIVLQTNKIFTLIIKKMTMKTSSHNFTERIVAIIRLLTGMLAQNASTTPPVGFACWNAFNNRSNILSLVPVAIPPGKAIQPTQILLTLVYNPFN
jgi:hypothetical protein